MAGTTLGRDNYGWDNFGPGQLWLGQLWVGTTLIWANYVWDNFGPGNFGPDNNGWYNFELIPYKSAKLGRGAPSLFLQVSKLYIGICAQLFLPHPNLFIYTFIKYYYSNID